MYFVRHPFDKWRLVIWQFLGCIDITSFCRVGVFFLSFFRCYWFPLLSDVDREELQHFHGNAGEHLG